MKGLHQIYIRLWLMQSLAQTTQHQPMKLPYIMVITATFVFTHLMSADLS